MFGRWGYFVGEELFACFPLREREHDLWIRLPREEQARALANAHVRPHRRLARTGWIEISVETDIDLTTALTWLRRAYRAMNVKGGEALPKRPRPRSRPGAARTPLHER
jgi:predicted DNA-binding protein (MmcQ/YjbR family)